MQYSCAYFERPEHDAWRRPSSPRSATSRPSCCSSPACACSTSAAAGAAWRSDLAEEAGAEVRRHHAVQRAAARSPRRAPRRGAGRPGALLAARLPRPRRAPSTASSRSACSSTSACANYQAYLRRRVPRLLTRRRGGAAPLDRRSPSPASPTSLDRQVHLPRRLHPGALGGAAGGRARGLSVTDIEILRAALRRDRCGTGASASSPAASEIARALRRAVLPDVGVLPGGIARAPSARPAARLPAAAGPRQERVPLTRDYIRDRDGRGWPRPSLPSPTTPGCTSAPAHPPALRSRTSS